MNYLAHFYLSYNDPGLLVGNFIADEVKGKNYLNYPEPIQKGILIHRDIDSFTDNHKIVEESKNRIRTIHRKFTPVIVDIYYDHILAKDWSQFMDTELNQFASRSYETLLSQSDFIPEKSQIRLNYMARYNWLYSYRNIDGIAGILNGMSRRTKFENTMDKAHIELSHHLQEFEREFHQFFPELESYIQQRIKEL